MTPTEALIEKNGGLQQMEHYAGVCDLGKIVLGCDGRAYVDEKGGVLDVIAIEGTAKEFATRQTEVEERLAATGVPFKLHEEVVHFAHPLVQRAISSRAKYA